MSVNHPQLRIGSERVNARNHRSHVRRGCATLLLLTLFVAVGCEESRVPVFPVSGKVSFKGKPPAGALVVLHPVGTANLEGIAPSGTVNDDGSFKITVYDPGDGAPQGDYVATVQWRKFVASEGGAGPNVLPEQYSSPATSPIKVSVQGGPTEIPPIAIN